MNIRPLNAARRAGVASFLGLVLLLSNGIAALASELQSITDFSVAAKAVEDYVAKYGAEHVLLVLDIDNTIMSMDSDLGSDHWYEWQDYLLKHEQDSPHLVGKTQPELLKVQGILYERGKMHPTQDDEPQLIGKLQNLGVATLVLTSRGPEFQGPTERELKRCGYDFKKSALPVQNVPQDKYEPYDVARPEKSGLTPEEIKRYNLGPARPVLLTNGVFMTAGQHKGMMLLTLLKKSNRDIKAVVYVDDNVRHVGSVFSAAVARNIDVSSFQYRHEEVRVQRFHYSDKSNMDAEWAAIRDGGKAVSASKPEVEPAPSIVEKSSAKAVPVCKPHRRLLRCLR